MSDCARPSILVVDDTPDNLTLMFGLLKGHYSVKGANNGERALKIVRSDSPPDLILLDIMMPGLSGYDVCRELKADPATNDIPIIFLTAMSDMEDERQGLEMGAVDYITKPVSPPILLARIKTHLENKSARDLLKEQNSIRQMEVELLQYRNRYHSRQQELALAKEQHIAHNQLEKQFLPITGSRGGWLVDLWQLSRDIMSGDSSAVVKSDDDRLLLFLADAMGHGLSAAVTSMLTTAFFNHMACDGICCQLGFRHLTDSTMNFAAHNLLEDEVFSGLVMELDPLRQMARYVSCGMPPLLVIRHGQVERIPGLNPPVSAYAPPFRLQEISLEGVSDILMSTDGLGDAELREGGCYRERLPYDLQATATVHELFARYEDACDDGQNDDDVTAVRLTAVGIGCDAVQHHFSSAGTLRGIGEMQRQVKEQLEAAGAGGERLDSLELALGEALLNAFEHGCLGMGTVKQQLILEGTYTELVQEASERDGVEITLDLTLLPRQGRLQAWIEVTDPGSGFSVGRAPSGETALVGRGLMIIQRSVDLVRRNSCGNRLILMQMFEAK
jgi:DNA-binding response OmpR family regulator/anti-sigma regulatory factor (Ser/Thr protein kinase)